ncbi:hypothetical protein TURU_164576 [Turdus rufiventris]|nr:hypothetical protein TURU_164576 [Turdus rufiventris]
MLMRIQVRSHEESQAPGLSLADPAQPSPAEKPAVPDTQPSAGTSQLQMQSWKELVSKVNAQMDAEQARGHPRKLQLGPKGGPRGSPQPPSPRRGAEQAAERDREDEEELQMDAGVIDREHTSHSQKEPVLQEPMMPDDAADPAQDPNNQGEDEFEEAELERPDFEEKVGGSEKFKELGVKEEPKEKPPKEDHGGEVDDNDDLELVKERAGTRGGRKDDYF